MVKYCSDEWMQGSPIKLEQPHPRLRAAGAGVGRSPQPGSPRGWLSTPPFLLWTHSFWQSDCLCMCMWQKAQDTGFIILTTFKGTVQWCWPSPSANDCRRWGWPRCSHYSLSPGTPTFVHPWDLLTPLRLGLVSLLLVCDHTCFIFPRPASPQSRQLVNVGEWASEWVSECMSEQMNE